jgi:putative effector of murein hydrolase
VALSALFLRAAQGKLAPTITTTTTTVSKKKVGITQQKGGKAPGASVTAAPLPAKPYSAETVSFLTKASVVAGAVSIAASRANHDYATPLRTIFHTLSTLTAFVWSARLPSAFNKIVHPLVTGTALSLAVFQMTGQATGESFTAVLKTYKVGSLDLLKIGAGDLLLFLLGPSVVSFALAMYSRKQLLQENLLIVMTATLVSSAGGLFGTAAFVRAIQLGGRSSGAAMVRLSVLARNVTTALSMAIAAILGGDIPIAASVGVLTGIIGATYGRMVLDGMGITDPVTRGLAVGSSGQGLGVASMVSESDAMPFAAMAMVLTAISSTVLVSIPAVREPLMKLALGA